MLTALLVAGALAVAPGVSGDARCEAGDAVACGQGSLDEARAACGRGDQAACVTVGIHLQDDPATAAEGQALFEAACEAGTAAGCTHAAVGLRFARGVAPDLDRAYTLAARACDAGHASGCCEQAAADRWGRGTAVDAEASVTRYTMACDAGAACGCEGLALRLREGRGIAADPVRADALLEERCDAGSLSACATLGYRLRASDDGEEEIRGRGLVARACDGGSLAACRSQAWERFEGNKGADPDPDGAIAALEAHCAAHDGESCDDLGSMLLRAESPDDAHILGVLEQACELGSADGCSRLGTRLSEDGDHHDLDGAIEAWERGVALGSTWSMRLLGDHLLAHGDPERGLALLGDACDRDNDQACRDLSDHHRDAERLAMASDVLWQACERDRMRPCHDLGELLTPQTTRPHFGDPLCDDARATTALARACEGGRSGACYLLGIRQRFGMGTEPDADAAFASMERGCELGGHVACQAAAWQLDNGVGVPADPEAAVARFTELCTRGHTMACWQLSARPWLQLLQGLFGTAP